MRGLIIKCNKYNFQDKLKSTKPDGIEKIKEVFRNESFENIILVLTCIEKGDKEEVLIKVVKRIEKLNTEYYHLTKVVIAPFVHLSKNIEEPKKSFKLIKLLSKKLENGKFKVSTVSFGTHKSSGIDFSGEPYAVSYFEFK